MYRFYMLIKGFEFLVTYKYVQFNVYVHMYPNTSPPYHIDVIDGWPLISISTEFLWLAFIYLIDVIWFYINATEKSSCDTVFMEKMHVIFYSTISIYNVYSAFDCFIYPIHFLTFYCRSLFIFDLNLFSFVGKTILFKFVLVSRSSV